MKTTWLIICVLFIRGFSPVLGGDFCVYEANYPNVKDYNVQVDTAALTIHPQGAYIELDLELTVSYAFQSWFFKNYTELEFMWQFTLPDQAIVDDFWIWLDDSILKPTIMDKWTAELLFSEVSSPVRNPGLLIQSFADREGQVTYYLRLYPIVRDEKRKFKIHYLLPARPTNETLRVWLPTSQLTSRRSPGAASLNLLFADPQRPTLIGATAALEKYHPEIPGWEFTIDLDYNLFVELVYPTPIVGKFFFSNFEAGSETFYQLAIYPPEVEATHTPRNFLILVDFNRFNTAGLDGELTLSLLKETMQQALSNLDSANIIVSYADLAYGANCLLACNESNLDQLFEKVLQRAFPSYSNFQPLLAAAAKFLQNQYHHTDIILLTNTDEISLPLYSREEFANQIVAMFASGTRLHIVDLENKSSLFYNQEKSQYETQLQSFYGQLCYQMNGNLFFLRYHAIKNILAALFYEKISHFQEVEIQTRFSSGYAYGKHFLALHEGYYPLRFPIMQIGRYRGVLPLEITILGKIRLAKSTAAFTITENDVAPGTSKLATAWYGDQIHTWLQKPQTNATIVDIMDLSLKHNILTPYTGFLIFRPEENQGYHESEDDGNGDINTRVEVAPMDSLDGDIRLTAYPNPFNAVVVLSFTLPGTVDRSPISLVIFNSLGQQVIDFKSEDSGRRTQSFIWQVNHGAPSVASGIYFAVLAGPNWKRVMKLVLLK